MANENNIIEPISTIEERKAPEGMTPITEEMHLEKEWYAEARNQTIETLLDFINHMMGDYDHDYGTVCHAIAACAMAAIHVADNHPVNGGITGFQASHTMWQIVRQMMYKDNKTGLRLLNYDDMLYPQYEYKFEKTISRSIFEELQKVARENLESNESAHPKVIAHWQSIVDGNVPFGYTIKEV